MAVGILMRWIHIAGVVTLLGGVVHARLVAWPGLRGQKPVLAGMAARWAPWIYASVAAIVTSGLYNFLTKPGYPPGYHMWFGIKMLLALHVIAVMFLLARVKDDEEKRARWMAGVIASGAAIILISGYLRWISTHV